MKAILYITIAVLLAVNNIFVNFRIGPLSFDRLLEFALFAVFFKSFLIEVRDNAYFRKYVLFIVVLAVLQILMNAKLAAFNNSDSSLILQSFFKCISFIVFSYLFLLIIKEDIKYLNYIIIIHLGICLFAILQHPLSPLSSQMHELKMMLFRGQDGNLSLAKKLQNQELYIDLGISNKFRLSGPFASSITFSYFLLSTFFLNLYMYLKTEKRMYILSTGFIILCSLLCQTRSLLLAEVVILISVFLFIHNAKLNSYKVIFTTVGLVASLIFIEKIDQMFSSSETTRLTKFNDSGSERTQLWATGVYAVMSNPFGVTDAQYQVAKQEMYNKYGNPGILHLPSHNGFINVGFNYTIFGYFIIIGFFFFLVKYARQLFRDYRILFYAFFIGYLLHSCFHNNFIFYSDYDVYYVLMLLPFQLMLQEKQSEKRKSDV